MLFYLLISEIVDLFKYLKSVLNYGTKWHDFNFVSMYSKMTNFNNPNELPKEMEFYTFEEFQNGTLEDEKGYCSVATIQDIMKQDYILTPGRYVGIEEQEDDGEPFEEKMGRLTAELSDMFAKSHELEEEIRKKLGAIGYEV